jgi:hypothetical protein
LPLAVAHIRKRADIDLELLRRVRLEGHPAAIGRNDGIALDATGVPPQIVVVQNWLEELKRLVPVAD